MSTLTATQKRALLATKLKAATAGPRQAPLSLAQQRLWFIDQMQAGQAVYTITAALRLDGDLNRDRLKTALDAVRARHDSLRTRFEDQAGTPLQIIDSAAPMPLRLVDHRDDPSRAEATLSAFAADPFDLAAGPLIRCLLIHTGPAQHILALAAHHIIADYRSLQVMIEDCVASYQGLPQRPLSAQYGDYAMAQRGKVAELSGQLDYWRDALDGVPALTDMPTDRPRPAKQSFAGARHKFSLGAELTRRIETLAQDQGATPYMVCLAAFHILHHRYCGADDICIGTTVSNRDRAEWQGLVGYFVNTLALRAEPKAEDDFTAFLARLRSTVLKGMRHQEVPFEQVVDATIRSRSLAHSPLFQSMFNLHEKQPDCISLPGLTLSPYPVGGTTARFDLCLDLFHGPELTGVLEYATALFDPETAERMAEDYTRILDAVTAEPAARLSRISLENDADRAVMDRINDTHRPVPQGGVAALISQMAERQGDKTALIAGQDRLSYDELDAAAGRLATYLAGRVPPKARIAVCLPRGADMVVALLAVLRIGASYIPLDPSHPDQRLRMILEESDPALILVSGDTPLDDLGQILDIDADRDRINAQPVAPADPVAGDALAYTIFTSGTTGRPKGVPIRQDSLVNLLSSMAITPGMTDADTLVAVTTPAFDIAALELFGPLLIGGTLVLADGYDVIDGQALAGLIDATDATMMQATPATWRLLIEENWQAPVGFTMLCGGEALDTGLADHLLQGGGRLWNMYGPTETTIWSACCEVLPAHVAGGTIPLGAPIANTTLHVLDKAGQTCPPGVAGELMIGGLGLSPGYLNRPDLTDAQFIEDPSHPGARLYRTGDLVRRLRDGTLVYLGRLDFQVKLRGFRIELGEIETALASDADVDQAVVSVTGTGDDATLTAYCRVATKAEDLEPRLRARAAAALPGYMTPAAYVFLDEFPLNTNGKVDRKRLPAAEAVTDPMAAQRPETGTESLLVQLWAEALDVPSVGRETEFFAAGGHSLLAMRMIARLPLKGSRAVPLRLLFDAPRLKDFAAALDREDLLTDTPPDPIPARDDATPRALSFAQDRQWALSMLDPDSAAYNLPAALRLEGPVDADRLGRAFATLCQCHEVLRSSYPEVEGKATVVVSGDSPALAHPVNISEAALPKALRRDAARPFDLGTGPLIRLTLYRTGAERFALLLVMHHIISDAQSVEVVLRELMGLYQSHATTPVADPLPIQYADYATWQKAQDFSASTQFWVDYLTGAPPLLELPTDFQRPAQQSSRGGSVDFTLSEATAQGLRDHAAAQGATPYMAFLGLFAAFLGRYSNSDEVVIGTPISQRPHPDLDQLAGMFINTLALRLPSNGARGFNDLLGDIRARCLTAFDHQDTPFEQVVDALAPDRSWSHNPIFQALFTWKTRDAAPVELADGLRWGPLALASSTSKMDIALAVLDQGDGFALRLEYATDLFRPDTARHMALAFETLVTAAVNAAQMPVGRLSLLHPEQASQIARWNDTGAVTYGAPVTLHGKLSVQAAMRADQIAIRHGSGNMSYGSLEARSDALAAHLQSRGIRLGDRVGIALNRCPDMITAMVGVMKTGAAYVPLDPNYPADRIAYIQQDAGLALILTDTEGAADTLNVAGFFDGPPGTRDTHQGQATTPTPVHLNPDDAAYVIYTSGSTGQPKGVVLTHGNAHALIDWAATAFDPDDFKGMLGSTSVCFDLSIFEIFVTLSLGGTLMLVDDLFALPDAPFRDQVTLINTVPTPMAELLKLCPLPASVRTVCLAGEPLPPALAKRVYDAGTVDRVWNLYGPSEDTTYSTWDILPKDGGAFNIGAPIAGTQAYVLDAELQQVPPGLPGELFLAGAGVAKGYWNRPDLTAERFTPNPFDTDGTAPVMYRTGDRVRRIGDGTLEYMGRGDRQVKIRGFRIEPGEVETALTAIAGIRAAVVDGWQDADGPLRLTAWVEGNAAAGDITACLAKVLPAHCVPTLFVTLEALPRLPNGKLDRNALPAPVADVGDAPVTEAPNPGPEATLTDIWARILGRTSIGRTENFFAVGGDSILAIQVVAAARDIGMALSPRDVFQFPSIAELARAVADRAALDAETTGPITGKQPLTPIQHWFFDRDLPNPDHWNQALVLTPATPLRADILRPALVTLADQHDALRARFTQTSDGWSQIYDAPGTAPHLIEAQGDITAAATTLQSGLSLSDGPLWGVVLCAMEDGSQRLALVIHHLIIDGVSWRILLEDLYQIYQTLAVGQTPTPRRRGTSPGDWVNQLAASDTLRAEMDYWTAITDQPVARLPMDRPDGANTMAQADRVDTHLDSGLTRQLLDEVPAAYPVTPEEVLIAALYLSLRDWSGTDALGLELESHGRADLGDDTDLSRTVGWLTGLYPVHLKTATEASPDVALRMVKDTLRAVPNHGVGYGVLRYIHGVLPTQPAPDLRFNYLGRAGAQFGPDSPFQPAAESAGPTQAANTPRDVALELNALATGDGLRLGWNFSTGQFDRATITALGDGFAAHLDRLVSHCLHGTDAGFTPSDFPDMDFDQSDLDDLLESL